MRILQQQKKLAMKRNCLYCGKEFSGRTDKLYCSDNCRAKAHNATNNSSRDYHKKTITTLNRNYQILSLLLEKGYRSVDMCELEMLGFRPYCCTSYHRRGKLVNEYSCFEINYSQNEERIYNLRKVEMCAFKFKKL